MTDYLAVFAVLLAVAAIVGYGVVQERRMQELARRLDRFDRRLSATGPPTAPVTQDTVDGSYRLETDAALGELRRRVQELDADLHRRWAELLYQQSVGGRQPILLHLPARVWVADPAHADPVRQAALRLADELGFEVAHAYPATVPDRGAASDAPSWNGRAGEPYAQRLLLARKGAADGLAARPGDDPRAEIRAALGVGGSGDESRLELPTLVLQAGRCAVQLGSGVIASDGARVVYLELNAAQLRELDADRAAFDPGRLMERAEGGAAGLSADLTERVRAAAEHTLRGLRSREEAVAAREREIEEQAARVRQERADLDVEADRIAEQIDAVRTAFDRQVQEFADQRAAMEQAAYLQAKGANADIAQLRAEIERLERRIAGARGGSAQAADAGPDPLPRREPGRYGPDL